MLAKPFVSFGIWFIGGPIEQAYLDFRPSACPLARHLVNRSAATSCFDTGGIDYRAGLFADVTHKQAMQFIGAFEDSLIDPREPDFRRTGASIYLKVWSYSDNITTITWKDGELVVDIFKS